MATMMTEIYDAFRDAGTSEEKARAAAVAMATFEPRFSGMEARLLRMEWMGGVNLALSIAIMTKLLLH